MPCQIISRIKPSGACGLVQCSISGTPAPTHPVGCPADTNCVDARKSRRMFLVKPASAEAGALPTHTAPPTLSQVICCPKLAGARTQTYRSPPCPIRSAREAARPANAHNQTNPSHPRSNSVSARLASRILAPASPLPHAPVSVEYGYRHTGCRPTRGAVPDPPEWTRSRGRDARFPSKWACTTVGDDNRFIVYQNRTVGEWFLLSPAARPRSASMNGRRSNGLNTAAFQIKLVKIVSQEGTPCETRRRVRSASPRELISTRRQS